MIPLHDYQKTAIEYGTNNNLFLGDDAGMGKTRQACGAIKGVLDKHDSMLTRPILIITRKKIFDNWLKELDLWLGDYHLILLDDVDKVRQFASVSGKMYKSTAWPEKTIVLIYHEAVRHLIVKTCLKVWGIIVLDEAHKVKNPKAHITKSFVKLKAYRLIAMTATKMDKSPLDMYVVLNWLYPRLLGTRTEFKNEYVDIIYFNGFPKIIGGKNLNKLASLIAPFTLSREKKDVLKDFPSLKFTIVDIELKDKQLEAYIELKKSKSLTVQLESEVIYLPNVLAQMVKAQQLVTDPNLLGLDIESAKLDWVYKWIEDHKDSSFIILANRSSKLP